MDNGNPKRKQKVKEIFEYCYKVVTIVKIMILFL